MTKEFISIHKELPINMHLCEIKTNYAGIFKARHIIGLFENDEFWVNKDNSRQRPTHWRYVEQDVNKRQQEADEWLSSWPTIDEFIDTCEDQELSDHFKKVRKSQLSQG